MGSLVDTLSTVPSTSVSVSVEKVSESLLILLLGLVGPSADGAREGAHHALSGLTSLGGGVTLLDSVLHVGVGVGLSHVVFLSVDDPTVQGPEGLWRV